MRSRLALLIGSILFSLLLAEATLRVYYTATSRGYLADLVDDRPLPPPDSELFLGDIFTMSPNPGIVYLGRPGLHGVYLGKTIQINREGWREDEIPFEKPRDTFRIVGIGDSVMFGWGVEEGERYLDLLEARLNRELPERHWETVTLAMPGYNLMNEIEVLRHVGLRYDPDLILYGYVANDVCLPRFVAERRLEFLTESFIAHYLRRGFAQRPPRVGRNSIRSSADGVASDDRRPWCDEENLPERFRHLAGEENLKRALDEFASIGRETGTPVVIVFDGRRAKPDNFSAEVPDGVTVLDLHEHFRAHLDAHGIDSYRHPSLRRGGESGEDHHPTAEGHRVIADGLFEALLAANLVPTH